MCLNDAHIFCRPDQLGDEVKTVLQMVENAYRKLNITEYRYRLSMHDPADTEKYVNNPELWEKGESALRQVFVDLGLPFVEAPGEAAFYGPKIDIQLVNVLGKEETYSQFELEYNDEDNTSQRPVMIHRGVISTMERMVAFLIEHYAGAFPTWLAPVQAIILPIADRHHDYANEIAAKLKTAGFRVEVDSRNEKLGKKIAEANQMKLPWMLVVGDKDIEAGTISVRKRGGEDLGAITFDDYLAIINDEIKGD
jgi:threonyl-tRNA synthetase